MPERPKLQFAFVTHNIPKTQTGLPKMVEILAHITLHAGVQLPITLPLTLLHGWLGEGEWNFGFDIYGPDGQLIYMPNSTVRAAFEDGKAYELAIHHFPLEVREPGRFEIEATCDDEVALRYPFFLALAE